MKLRDFLTDKWLFIVLQILLIVFAGIIITAITANLFIVLVLLIAWAVADIFILGYEYVKKKNYYDDFFKTLDALDQKYLMADVMKEPSFAESAILYDTLKIMLKAMNDRIADFRGDTEGYREYIESWVHEIKTPIATARLIVENDEGETAKSIAEELVKIEDFVEQALYYSRSNTLEKDYIVKETELEKAINSVVKRNAKALIENRIKVSKEEPFGIVMCDEKWLFFILNQIVVNSIKYKRPDAEISFRACREENKVVLEITDNGIGIPAADLSRVFEKGFTGENGRRFSKSTGMGLYLCKKLCDKMGLGIAVTSGEGTKVAISFPMDGARRSLTKT